MSSCTLFFVLIGKADVLEAALAELSVNGGVRPAGEAIELGTRKSSRFMGSGAAGLASSICWWGAGGSLCGGLRNVNQRKPRG